MSAGEAAAGSLTTAQFRALMGRNRYHGVELVKLEHGLITHCRQCRRQSTLTWREFSDPTAC